MVRTEKRRRALQSVESDLRALLQNLLPQAAQGARTLIFTNSRFNAHGLQEGHRDEDAETLLELALTAEQLRAELELPQSEGPAHSFLRACQEANDLENENRLGPRRLAERLLSTING